MTRCISCGRLPTEGCNELTHAAHDRMWAAENETDLDHRYARLKAQHPAPLLGPQPSPVSCCDSCQVLVRAVARLAYAIGYDETGDEMTELAEEFESPGGEVREVNSGGALG